MELVTNIIIGYLKHNKRLVVPQLGTFIVKQPTGEIIFSELMRGDDGVLRSLLVAYGLNELAANGMIDRLRFEIKHAVAEGSKFTITDFGEFSAGDNGTIRFRHKPKPRIYGGNIKPPLERFEEERLKLQRIQRIRQQQSENITGHSTHRKLRTSHVINTHVEQQVDDDDLQHGKPERYLRGLKYENRKGRNQDDDNFTSGHNTQRGSGKILFVVLILIALGVGIWFTWQWTKKLDSTDAIKSEPVAPIIEPTDSLSAPVELQSESENKPAEESSTTELSTTINTTTTTSRNTQSAGVANNAGLGTTATSTSIGSKTLSSRSIFATTPFETTDITPSTAKSISNIGL